MSALGALLELLHDGQPASVQVTYRDTQAVRPNLQLKVLPTPGKKVTGLRWQGAGPFPRPIGAVRRFWYEAPDRLRVQISEGDVIARVAVRNGAKWWRWDSTEGESDGEIEPTGPHSILQFPPLLCPPILDPARLIADFRLEPLGARVIADRDVYRARGTPRLLRPDVDIWDEFDFDAEHATVLRRAMGEAGRIIAVTEAIEVLYDNKIEPGRFDFGLRP